MSIKEIDLKIHLNDLNITLFYLFAGNTIKFNKQKFKIINDFGNAVTFKAWSSSHESDSDVGDIVMLVT